MAGQPNKVTAIAVQPSPHFFENPRQYSTNPDNQALTRHSSRKSIKPLLGSSLLLFSLTSATCAIQALPLALLHTQHSITPFHQAATSNSTPQLPGEEQDGVPGTQPILLFLTKHREFRAIQMPKLSLGALPCAWVPDYRFTQHRAAPYGKPYHGTKDAALSQSAYPRHSTAVCWVTASFTSLHIKL